MTITHGRYEIHPFEGAPALRLCVRPRKGVFVADEQVSRGVLYRIERDRGYDSTEDLFSPGYFSTELGPGDSIAMVASTEGWEWLDLEAGQCFDAEQHRIEKLLHLPGVSPDGMLAQLVLAADQFVILPGTRPEEEKLAQASGNEARTVVAGYHWFTDWGRDTMISLERLTLCTGRHREARAILHTFGHYVKDGLLPNHFPEGHRTALYNTVDASFWFFHALDRYLQTTRDQETLRDLLPTLRSILEHHVADTHFGIGMDPADGLLKAGADGYQLTWMDAKVEDWVVTPRRGKPVEIQALWYNALRLMADWAEANGERSNAWYGLTKQAKDSFHA